MDTNKTPKVIIVGLASCFGCQLQITNDEAHLLDVLGQIDLTYWQLASSEPLQEQDFDIAVIEGAVTTAAARDLVIELRKRARKLIAIGACAVTGGIPSLANNNQSECTKRVYGKELPSACGDLIDAAPVSDFVEVDYLVRCCPIDTAKFIEVLQGAIYGSNRKQETTTMCAQCKINETQCLYEQGKLCMGLITNESCGARCVKLGRVCNGCAGISADANLASAIVFAQEHGYTRDEFMARARIFNKNIDALDEAKGE